jgi:hypothetical protein
MIQHCARPVLVSLIVVSLAGGLFAAADPISRRDAARLQAKIEKITKNASGKPATATRTSISEAELNSYLRYEMGDRIPEGVTDLWVTLLDENRVEGRAVVDLNQVAKSKKTGGMLDPWSLVGGTLPLTVNGLLRTKDGVGTFGVESVSISGVPVPSRMLQEIVGYYSRSTIAPQGVSLDKPFELPVGIREIQLARGQAIVVQ